MGKSAYKNTFKFKNTYENILTGINKEEMNLPAASCGEYNPERFKVSLSMTLGIIIFLNIARSYHTLQLVYFSSG